MAAKNKIAIVTGAGSGVGKAATLALLKAGYSVALAGRRRDVLEQAVEESGAGSRGLAVETDVSDPPSVEAPFAQAETSLRPGDVLFHKARVSAPGGPPE